MSPDRGIRQNVAWNSTIVRHEKADTISQETIDSMTMDLRNSHIVDGRPS